MSIFVFSIIVTIGLSIGALIIGLSIGALIIIGYNFYDSYRFNKEQEENDKANKRLTDVWLKDFENGGKSFG